MEAGAHEVAKPTGEIRLRADTDTMDQHADTSGHSLNDGNWHHIAVTYDEASSPQLKLYVDYELAASLIPNTPDNKLYYDPGYPLQIGSYTGDGLEGWIDEVRFTDEVLSTSEFLRTTDGEGMMFFRSNDPGGGARDSSDDERYAVRFI